MLDKVNNWWQEHVASTWCFFRHQNFWSSMKRSGAFGHDIYCAYCKNGDTTIIKKE